MRKTFVFMMAFALCMGISSCGDKAKGDAAKENKTEVSAKTENAVARLEKQIKYTNRRLPQRTPDGMTTEKIKLDGDYVVMTFTMPDDKMDMDAMAEQLETMKAAAMAQLEKQAKDPVMKNAVTAKKGLRYCYVGKKSKKTVTLEITVDELASVVNGE